MSSRGISDSGRAELAAVAGRRRFIAPRDVQGELGISAPAAARKLANWADQGWLRRVRRGLYIPVPVEAEQPQHWSQDPMVVADAVWAPCYFTGWTAANHWGLTEQVFRTTVLRTTRRVRESKVRLLDSDFLVAHISEVAMGWGLSSVWHEEVRLRLADQARTVIDILDRPSIGGGIRHAAEILGAYLDDNDAQTLVKYGDLLGNGAVFKRLGYLVEALDLDAPEIVAECRARVSAGVSLLDPDGPRDGVRVSQWGIRANVRVVPESPS
jgi:predicted transcriptional regulator of viral defense system